MQRYQQLTSQPPYQISGLSKAGLQPAQIADEVGVDKSTLARELRRNQGQPGWRPQPAQGLRHARRQACTNARQF